MSLDPLRFESIFRRYLWGGRRLLSTLGKQIGAGEDYAESWEIVDHGDDQSIVAAGPLAGQTLRAVCSNYSQELFGRHAPQSQFPLLFKFLDAHRSLSVQVHPNDQQGAQLDPPDRGKTEAWIVLHAEPGSQIYAGLRAGVDRSTLQAAAATSTIADCLHAFEPAAGDCLFIPAGTVHALGAGLVIAEIQQASDTTFRLWDWNRVGPEGEPRELHVEQALDVIDFAAGPVRPQVPAPSEPPFEELVACNHFVWRRATTADPFSIPLGDRFHLLVVVDGAAEIEGDPAARALGKGECLLLPARCGESVRVVPGGPCTLLDVHLPD